VTPWLRTLRAASVLLVLMASAPVQASYAAEPIPGQSRAGSRAGEGRERPGREATPRDEDAARLPGLDPGVPDAPDVPGRPEATADSGIGPDIGPEPTRNATPSSSPSVDQAVGSPARTTEPVLRILPLGSGLVLIGLGLGLAILALRVRRG
jgi:hypothetical protein